MLYLLLSWNSESTILTWRAVVRTNPALLCSALPYLVWTGLPYIRAHPGKCPGALDCVNIVNILKLVEPETTG